MQNSESKVFFVSRLLNWIEKGGIIRKTFVWFLRGVAVVFGLSGLGLFISNWGYTFDLGFFGFFGLVITQVLLVVTLYIVIRILFIRAGDIDDLTTGKYTVIPIFSIISKLNGEVFAVLSFMSGLMSSVLLLLAGSYGARQLMMMPGIRPYAYQVGQNVILSAFSVLLVGTVLGFLALLVGYFWSEVIIVIVDIAESLTKKENST